MFRLLALLIIAAASAFAPALAAESYDNCTGYIDSVPASITTPGTWCLRKSHDTAITRGSAIRINSHNVTLDCNDFVLDGSSSGASTGAVGIFGNDRLNVTVRRCGVQGFLTGIQLTGAGSSGNLVEDNRLEQNRYAGIYVLGDNNRVQRNRVYDTGGTTIGQTSIYGIRAAADVLDNSIDNVLPSGTYNYVYGIFLEGTGTTADGNSVLNMSPPFQHGIGVARSNIRISNNHIVAGYPDPGTGYGIVTLNFPIAFCTGNSIAGFHTGISSGCVLGE